VRYDGPKADFPVSEELAFIAATIVRDREAYADIRDHELYGAFAAQFTAEFGRAPRQWLRKIGRDFAIMNDVYFSVGAHPDVF
jgi:hypothetical protein